MDDFKDIILYLRKKKNKRNFKIVENPTKYKLIGKGVHGAVFKISEEKCLKIFANRKLRKEEEEVLRDTKRSPYFPNFIETGPDYIVM